MDKVQLAKTITRWTVGIGTGKIFISVINNNTPRESLTEKVSVTAGGFVLGAMVSEAAGDWTDQKIDEFVANWRDMKKA